MIRNYEPERGSGLPRRSPVALAARPATGDRPRLVGDVATEREALSADTRCAAIDEWFQADSRLRSLVVLGAEGEMRLVNRSAFYEALAGRLGYGWSLFHDAPLSKLLDRVVPGSVIPASTSLIDAGLRLLEVGQVDSEQDLMVSWADGRVGTLAVAVVLAELFQVHADHVRRLESSESRLRALVQSSFDVLLILDRSGTITYASPSAEAISGLRPAELVGSPLHTYIRDEDARIFEQRFAECLAGANDELAGEFQMRNPAGGWGWFELNLRNLLHRSEVGGVVVHYRDISLRRQLEDRLRYDALHDTLTGLPNRALIVERASRLLDRARDAGTGASALFIDLDHFKDVNDTLGHGAGDELLCLVAARLSTMLRHTDTVGRLGGDEFVILLGETSEAEFVSQRVLELFERPFILQGRERSVSASIGVAVGECGTVEELVQHADIALYEAKSAGRSCYRVFADEMLASLEGRISLEHDLAAAVEQAQFFVVYQPIFQLDSLEMAGVEALLRWRHPTRGELAPDEFIPSLETTGLIRDVGRQVLHEACRQIAAWQALGHELRVSVNISSRQLEDDQLVADVADALASSGLDASSLVIEITESMLVRDCEATIEKLRALKSLGLRLAVDDLGTGYSSLAYLRHFPIDIVKIDKSFVAAADEPGGVALVHTLIELGRNLGLVTVAEGIETLDQLELLQREGCLLGQGYLLGRPLGATSTARRLAGFSAETPSVPSAT